MIRISPSTRVEQARWSITSDLRLLVCPGVSDVEVLRGILPVSRTYQRRPATFRGSSVDALLGDGSTNYYLLPRHSYPARGDVSVFCVALATSLATDQAFACKNSATSIPLIFGVENTSGKLFQYRFIDGEGDRYWTSPTLAVTTNTAFFAGVRHASNGNDLATFFLNGVFDYSVSGAGSLVSAPSEPDVDFGIGNYSASGGKWSGLIGLVAVWGRLLSDAEFLSLYADPWQLFAPRSIIIPVSAIGYVHPTLSNARMGSLTSTTGVPLVDYAF